MHEKTETQEVTVEAERAVEGFSPFLYTDIQRYGPCGIGGRDGTATGTLHLGTRGLYKRLIPCPHPCEGRGQDRRFTLVLVKTSATRVS